MEMRLFAKKPYICLEILSKIYVLTEEMPNILHWKNDFAQTWKNVELCRKLHSGEYTSTCNSTCITWLQLWEKWFINSGRTVMGLTVRWDSSPRLISTCTEVHTIRRFKSNKQWEQHAEHLMNALLVNG